jgi:hypothetical protein
MRKRWRIVPLTGGFGRLKRRELFGDKKRERIGDSFRKGLSLSLKYFAGLKAETEIEDNLPPCKVIN